MGEEGKVTSRTAATRPPSRRKPVLSGDEVYDDDITSDPPTILGDEFCDREAHEELRRKPSLLLRLRPWAELEQDIGECPDCGSTLHVDWSEARKSAERRA